MDTSSPSVALIRLLKEITRLGKALDKVTTENHAAHIYRVTSHFATGRESRQQETRYHKTK